MLNLVYVQATDIPDSWFQLLYRILYEGRKFEIDKGSYAGSNRLEYDWVTIHIRHPQTRPLLPSIPAHYNIPDPVAPDYLDEYVPYVMTAEIQENEEYTYGSRLKTAKCSDGSVIDQIEEIIKIYKKFGYRNNQLVLRVTHPDDFLLDDPACLQLIDTRIQDNKLHFYIYFRSWDLYSGYPANLAAIAYLQEYMAGEIGVECGEFICTSKGLHLYDYVIDLAKIRCMKGDW